MFLDLLGSPRASPPASLLHRTPPRPCTSPVMLAVEVAWAGAAVWKPTALAARVAGQAISAGTGTEEMGEAGTAARSARPRRAAAAAAVVPLAAAAAGAAAGAGAATSTVRGGRLIRPAQLRRPARARNDAITGDGVGTKAEREEGNVTDLPTRPPSMHALHNARSMRCPPDREHPTSADGAPDINSPPQQVA